MVFVVRETHSPFCVGADQILQFIVGVEYGAALGIIQQIE